VLIDAEDLCRVRTHGLWISASMGAPYVRDSSVYKTCRLGRFIMRAKPGEIVKYRNGDPMDCRKANLCKVSQ
jgi:hypothetical protein